MRNKLIFHLEHNYNYNHKTIKLESAINVRANQLSGEISPTGELESRSGPPTDKGQELSNNFLENNPVQTFLV